MSGSDAITVLIAGTAGASLGTEIAKSLVLAGGYRILGCDINPLAYGHFDANFAETFLVDASDYVAGVKAIATRNDVQVVIPGAEKPARILAAASATFADEGIVIAQNAPDVVDLASDKARCFERLQDIGLPVPQTRRIETAGDVRGFPMPCIIKPSLDSGGSSFVFFCRSDSEAELYATYLLANHLQPILQAYIPEEGGEFTIGVLSDLGGNIEGVIALQRSFTSKLSVMTRGTDFLISSGYTQGRIDTFPEVCAAARRMAEALGSRGPLNVQGRITPDGQFLPFEINPRFSASTYLRSLAGFNEVDHFIRHLLARPVARPLDIRPGWYLRTLAETVTTAEKSPA
ncbi:MAG: ATP-grasp domain-containing protein [Rhodobacteraceae bacterium]|nr:ATP-grasp domain-containing protein [Paracoccaceae bacterium]